MGLPSFLHGITARDGQQHHAIKSAPPHGQDEQLPDKTPDTIGTTESQEGVSEKAQTGVQLVEAVAIVWDKSHLMAAYGL